MFKPANPGEAYRKVAFDACVAGSSGPALVRLCIEDVRAALDQALWADANARADIRRNALARAQNGLAALRLGVDPESSLATALLTFYDSMARSVTASQFSFDRAGIEAVRTDIDDVARAILK